MAGRVEDKITAKRKDKQYIMRLKVNMLFITKPMREEKEEEEALNAK